MANTKMADVARMAGVSLATVGRVIHQNGYVSAEKRKEIERIIEETGYVPNKIAQGLKSSKSKLIGHMTFFNPNMLYEQISEAINRSAYSHGYNILTLTSHKDRADENRQVEELIGHQVDGVIITSNASLSGETVEKFTKARIPVVMIERTRDLPNTDCVAVDDFNGAYEALGHILEKGHRNVGFIGMKGWHEVEKQRYDGYCKALEAAGIGVQERMVYFTEVYGMEEGRMAAEMLLSQENPPTALFMTSDIFACGVMQFCYGREIRIPGDLSLIGYDNTLSALLAPPITSMGLPASEIGEQAMALLDRRMRDFHCPSRSVTIKPVLVDRGTVKEIR